MIYLITMSSNTHKKIIRFDISVNKVLIMYVFNTSNHLKLRDETCFITHSELILSILHWEFSAVYIVYETHLWDNKLYICFYVGTVGNCIWLCPICTLIYTYNLIDIVILSAKYDITEVHIWMKQMLNVIWTQLIIL